MSCQARIRDKEFVIPGTTETCHMTKECGGVSFKKVSIDDGEALQHICKGCVKRFMTKGTKQDSWYGWFDCTYPEEARVKFSPWYNKIVKEAALKKKEPLKAVENITEKMAAVTLSVSMSKKEMLLKEIASVEEWMRGEGKTKFSEQPKMRHKLLHLREKLNELNT
jgi:hypothetical protein